MKRIRRVQAVLALMICSYALTASAMVLTTPIQVVRFQLYTDYGNGDVVFEVNATFTGCYGFWLSPADPGYKQAYAALMMVKATGGTMVVHAYDNSVWPGSSSYNYCRVRSLAPE